MKKAEKISVLKNSDFTMMVPESQADLVEREGVVIFVNKQNPALNL